jgi:TctA family transporter
MKYGLKLTVFAMCFFDVIGYLLRVVADCVRNFTQIIIPFFLGALEALNTRRSFTS